MSEVGVPQRISTSWMYFFRRANDSSVDELLDRLPDPVFERAVGVLEMIPRTPDQRRHYDARLKWELDENTRIQTAFEEGEAKGKIEGEARGEAGGEARGEARVRIELIRTLEGLLRLQISSDAELRGKSLEELLQRGQFLQQMIRNRPSLASISLPWLFPFASLAPLR